MLEKIMDILTYCEYKLEVHDDEFFGYSGCSYVYYGDPFEDMPLYCKGEIVYYVTISPDNEHISFNSINFETIVDFYIKDVTSIACLTNKDDEPYYLIRLKGRKVISLR